MNKKLREVKKAADAARPIFIEYDGVLGVGYGYKCTGGQVTDKLAVVIWVEKKLLNDKIVSGQHIPAQYAGYPTDVEMVQFSSDKGTEDTTGLHEGRSIFEFLDWGKIHRLNVEQKDGTLRHPGKVTPGPIGDTKPEFNSPDIDVRDNLFIIEDDGTLTYLTDGEVGIPDFVGSWNLFREEFGDDYDFVSLYFDEAVRGTLYLDNQFAHLYVDREDSGYNWDPLDRRTSYDIDSTRLLGFGAYFYLHRRCLLHEAGHYWLFYVNYKETPDGEELNYLHEDFGNWNVLQSPFHPGRYPDSDRSPMYYGFEEWIQDPANPAIFQRVSNYEGVEQDYAQDAESWRFNPLEQYLMGFLHKEAVASSRDFPPQYPVSGGDYQIIEADLDGGGASFQANPLRTITAENVIYAHGERIPNHLDSQRVFHMAVIAITNDLSSSAEFLDRAEEKRVIHAEAWREATEGRSVIDVSLLRPNVDDIYIRENLDDQGDESYSEPFWDSPDIFVRNENDDKDRDEFRSPDTPNGTIHQSPKSGQDNWVYARISNRGGDSYENVQVNFYLANFHGFSQRDTVDEAIPRTEVIYPVDWHPDSLIGFEADLEVPRNGTAVAKVCWPCNKIPAQSEDFKPCLLVEIFPLGPEPRKLHHVWENRKLAQKNITIDYVQGEVCPNPTPPAPYRHYLPFTFGHTLTTSKTASVELERNVDDPHLTVYLDPGDALRTLYRIGNRLYHLVPPEREDDAGSPASKLQELVPRPVTGSAVVDIPAGTELGIQCGICEKTVGDGMHLRFCDDTRVMLSCSTFDYRPLGLIPVEGFEYEVVEGRPVLKMTDPHRAVFPVSLVEEKQYQMGLLVKGDENTVKMPVRVRIKQRNDNGRVVGGIDFEARPCKPKKAEPVLY